MLLRISSKNRAVKTFDKWEDKILDYIKSEFENNNLLVLNMEAEDNNSLDMEFGEKCCIITIANDEKGEIYQYVKENSVGNENFIDLYINCYPKNWLCFDIGIIIETIKRFSITTEPDPKYKWEITYM
jgi:hypothetical protein